MIYKKKIVLAGICLFLGLSLGCGHAYTQGNEKNIGQETVSEGQGETNELEKQLICTGDYLYQSVTEPAYGSVGGEWLIVGLERSEYLVEKSYEQAYLRALYQSVKEKRGVLDNRKYTEYSRVILALTALGEDVQDIAGYNLLVPLCDFKSVCMQGINGPVWALIALDSGNYELPKRTDVSEQTTRDKLIDYILEQQLSDGGWNLGGEESDADLTAMAVQALCRYRDKRTDVENALDRALNILDSLQKEDGGYESWGEENAESTAQVLIALCAMKIDVQTDRRFVKNGNNVYQALLSYRKEDGSFSHVKNQDSDLMATEQAYLAIVSYWRMLHGESFLYDMSL